MKNTLWIAAIVLAFIAGYFTRGVNQDGFGKAPQTQPTQKISKADDSQISSEQLSTAAKAIFAEKEKEKDTIKTSQNQNTSESQTASTTSQAATEPAQTSDANTTNKYPNEISDVDIDKIVPAPFNESLKHHHGEVREKFKEYANASVPNDWDIRMQNKISDFVLSNPYAKNISVEFIGCKAELCELRLYENKKGVWSHIMSEMALQDWWDIGGYSASGNTANKDKPETTAWHVLLPKK